MDQWGSGGGGNGQFEWPTGIAVGPDGDVYVADTHNHRIQKFAPGGTFLKKWSSTGSGLGQFDYPTAIAFAPGGSFYITDAGNEDSRIQKFAEVPLESDTTAPVTSPSSPQRLYAFNAPIRLDATDVNGSGGKRVTYEATGAQQIPQTAVSGDQAQLTISAEGQTTLTYFSTDFAGNVEQPAKNITITVDKTAPRVKSTAPQHGATQVAPGEAIKATFSEAMYPSTVSWRTFRLLEPGSTTPVPAWVDYDAQTRTATLVPDAPLKAGTTYTARINLRARDLAYIRLDQFPTVEGNQKKQWRFTVVSP